MKNMFSSNDEKLTEKAFSQSLIVSILSILLCVVALCSITYAWFTTNLSSGENVIESSLFALDIQVFDNNDSPVYVTDNNDGTYLCTFENAGKYTVVMKMTDDTTASKGYCEITTNSTNKNQTEPISKDISIGVESFSFTVEISNADTTIVFEPKWGISATADIADGGLLVVPTSATSGDEYTQE